MMKEKTSSRRSFKSVAIPLALSLLIIGGITQSILWLPRMLKPDASLALRLDNSVIASSLAFSPDTKYLVAGGNISVNAVGRDQNITRGDGQIKSWDIASGALKWTHGGFEGSLAYSPDGKTICVGNTSHVVQLLDAKTGKVQRALEAKKGPIGGIIYSPDGHYFIVWSYVNNSRKPDSNIEIWDAFTLKLQRSFTMASRAVLSCAIAPDAKKVAVVFGDAGIDLWDTTTHDKPPHLLAKTGQSASFSPDGGTLAAVGRTTAVVAARVPGVRITGGFVSLIDSKTGKLIWTVRDSQGTSGGQAVSFSPNGQILACETLGATSLWSVRSHSKLFDLVKRTGDSASGNSSTSIAFSRDGKLFACRNDNKISVWEVTALSGGQSYVTPLY